MGILRRIDLDEVIPKGMSVCDVSFFAMEIWIKETDLFIVPAGVVVVHVVRAGCADAPVKQAVPLKYTSGIHKRPRGHFVSRGFVSPVIRSFQEYRWHS